MDNLPIELIEHISWFIDNKKDLLNFLLTSKDFYEFLSKNNYYNKFYPEIDRKYINENYIKLENNYSNSIFKLNVEKDRLIFNLFFDMNIKNVIKRTSEKSNKLILDINSYFIKHNLINIYLNKYNSEFCIFYHQNLIKLIFNDDTIKVFEKRIDYKEEYDKFMREIFFKPIISIDDRYMIFQDYVYDYIDKLEENIVFRDDKFMRTEDQSYIIIQNEAFKVTNISGFGLIIKYSTEDIVSGKISPVEYQERYDMFVKFIKSLLEN